jgi:uncharacterized protein
MITRRITDLVRKRFRKYPIVTITGPRQSGKSTLCRLAFPDLPVVSLEAPDIREEAIRDPRRFLSRTRDGLIIDEAQRAPQLFSYLQDVCDERRKNGQFVLTGSQQFLLLEGVSQSLAGRSSICHLLPPSLDELRLFDRPPRTLEATLLAGAYPRIHDQKIDPYEWHGDYIATYVERDVRQVLNIRDLAPFRRFLALCAGRTGQILNLDSLGSDAGVDGKTVKAWLSVLESSFLVIRLPPLLPNLNKRLVRTPKLYFLDTGLLCRLLGIRTEEQLLTHPLRGAIFETFVVCEVLKARFHRGETNCLHYYRDHGGTEIDLVLEEGRRFLATEIKAGTTVATDFFKTLDRLPERLPRGSKIRSRLVYGGDRDSTRDDTEVISWSRVADVDWAP